MDVRLERWLYGLVVAHTVAVGLALLAVPAFATRFGGWEGASPLFFPRQAGVFHLVLALGYVHAYVRYGSITLLVAAKATALVFLGAYALTFTVPWIVPFSAVADGLMGLAVLLVHRRVAAG